MRADGVEKEVETSSATKLPVRPMIEMRHTACRSLIAVNIAPRAPRAGGEPILTRGRVWSESLGRVRFAVLRGKCLEYWGMGDGEAEKDEILPTRIFRP